MTPALLHEILWPDSELPNVLTALAGEVGMPATAVSTPPPPSFRNTPEWIGAACAQLGLECEETILYGGQIAETLRSSPPSVVQVNGHGWLVLTDVRGRRARLLTPDLSVRDVPIDDVRHVLCHRFAEPHHFNVERLLTRCGIEPGRMAVALDALIEARLHAQRIGVLYAVRVPPGTNFSRQLLDAGVLRWFGLLITAHAAEYALLLVAWAVIGRAALLGRVDPALLAAWLLLLATMIPCRMLTIWARGVVATRAGGLLRQRLLAGILRLEPEEVRHEGAGRFLGRAIEVESVESLAVSGGLASLLALVEILAAGGVLGAGGALLELPLLAMWCVLTAMFALRYWRARRTWTDARLTITHQMVERMVGHRTRLAQQPPAAWHLDEDQRLQGYLATSQAMDVQGARLVALIPRGWFLVGVLGLAPAFLAEHYEPTALAISLGGVVLAWRALRRLTTGLGSLSGAAISWSRIAPLFQAAARTECSSPAAQVSAPEAVIEARDLTYQYSGHGRPVIAGLDLEIRPGEKLLVQGRSGGGKSTLVALLAGLRQPASGLLLLGGLDQATLGAVGWRRRISAAPQYHDNHVLGGPFAYNLLLGRRWPPTEEDLRAAENVARDAGLGPLLDRMPDGMMQMVGETGWQLSSGERGRLFLCRALLSRADLVILDESFAALDPHTLGQALQCSLQRAKSLLVVAHP
jgi:ATP-binding cassette, subfamily B, bacterial